MPASEIYLGKTGYAQINLTNAEKYTLQGYSWRIGTGYVSLANSGDYVTINFTTPATGTTLYSFASVDKSGNELLVSLIEGGTYTGGTAASLYNLNRVIGDSNAPFTAKTGLSTAGVTISGGVEAPVRMVPGTAGGNEKPGGASESAGFILFKPNTSYTLKLTAKGAVTVTAIFSVAYVAP